ncbi:MAG: hypothetical protein U0L72_00690 [Acutalibacteraceae bacterium]|nr:hypothetical protein [Acutalibacteraceae bacterium]
MTLKEVKPNMHKSVIYNSSVYQLESCVLWLDEKNREFKYSLNLIDKNKNCVLTVPIEKVEVITDEIRR